MFDGKQVLTITNKIKSSDIGGLSKELVMQKGTGNYDANRTKYNIEFIPLCSTNLASSTYKTLYKNNVEFNKNNKNINLLNGCIITSGQEFFKSLGMNFEDTGRKYLTGEHKGKPINKVVINNTNDIPEQVLNYFKYSHEFLSNLVGKENVVYSAIHFSFINTSSIFENYLSKFILILFYFLTNLHFGKLEHPINSPLRPRNLLIPNPMPLLAPVTKTVLFIVLFQVIKWLQN